MENKRTRIVMADDHQMVISSIALMLEHAKHIEVVAIVKDGNKLLQYLNGHSSEVDVVILDLHMPQLDGLSVIPVLKSRFAHIKVVVLSMYYTPQILAQVKSAGADTFVHKAEEIEVLASRIDEAVSGKKNFPQYQTANETYTNELLDDAFRRISVLTEREKQVARYIKDGYTTPKIAQALYLSEYTVDTHRKNILRKLELKSTADLIKFAVENKL
jgi:DNA-binding NarL/FixJ family response regulator